jgi:predicted phosphodiesterase
LTEETFEKCLKDSSEKVQKSNDMDWQEIVEKYNLGIHYDTLRKSQQPTPFGGAFIREYYINKMSSENNEDNYLKELQVQKREVEKEKVKLQTEKLEYSRWLREEARDELITEKIVEAINNLPPLNIPEVIPVVHNSKEGALIFGDEHFAVEFEILGLYGEIINAYSPEIFKDRMWDLLNRTIEIVKKEGFSKIHVFSMGDFTDGVLRVGQLFKLRYGVVEGTVIYADFITNWLNELTKYVNVEFQMVHGNHSELRMLGQPKGTFKDDNMGLVVYESIKNRLDNNPNFILTKNPTGLIFANVAGFNVLGIHGEVKNMENALKDFSNTYKTQIDILLAGHLHHSKSETVGINRDVINVPSIIGVDLYSMSLNKTSNAGATFVVFEEGKGKVIEYNIKLN